MKVFFPFRKTENKYFDEIENFFPGEFIFDSFERWADYENIEIVNIHWPEAIFDFKNPSSELKGKLYHTLSAWKQKGIKIIYTVHNLEPHNGGPQDFQDVYRTIIDSSDAIIHLGNYSRNLFMKLGIHKNQEIIEHPIFLTTPAEVSQDEARRILNISQDERIVLVFGALRSQREKEIIYEAAKSLKSTRYKILIAKYRVFSPRRYGLLLALKAMAEDFFKIIANQKISTKDFWGGKIEESEIQNYFMAADAVLIPRVSNLNSGVLFMAYRFNKPVIAPAIGNISEFLLEGDNYEFDPKDNKSLSNAISQFLTEKKSCNNYSKALEMLHPKIIAEKYYQFFTSILNLSS